MPNLSPVALIGLASAVAAIAPLHAQPPAGPNLPSVHSIVLRRDTIWFCARVDTTQRRTAFAFVRSSREWLNGPVATLCATEREKPSFDDSLVVVGRGVSLRVVRPALESDSGRLRRSYLRLTDSVRRRRIDLQPVYTKPEVQKLVTRGTLEVDTTSTWVGDAIVNDSLVWVGVRGGFPEGEGVIGGIYRVNRKTGAWRFISDSVLHWHSINGLAQSGKTLWIATEQPAELRTFGNAGLLRMTIATGRWSAYTDRNSPLPDALIRDVAADGRSVAVATEKGLAVAEIAANGRITKWNVRHYEVTAVDDSVAISLVPRPAVDTLSRRRR